MYQYSAGMARTVHEVLSRAQQLGTLGDRPIDEVIAHASQFADALGPQVHRVIDLGTGAGVPGLVIAQLRPEMTLTLLDRRQTRMDALRLAVQALGWADRITVVAAEAADLGRDPTHAGQYDAAVSRGFGPPEATARAARPFLKNGGSLIVSEPPDFDPTRWPAETCERAGFASPEYRPGVVVLEAIPC